MLCTSPLFLKSDPHTLNSSDSLPPTPLVYPFPAHPTKIQAFTERGGDPTFVNSVVIVE